jgi:hypothetical protein
MFEGGAGAREAIRFESREFGEEMKRFDLFRARNEKDVAFPPPSNPNDANFIAVPIAYSQRQLVSLNVERPSATEPS